MSIAQVQKFITFISRDPAAFEEASKGATERAAFVANIVRYANAKGYDFTEDEARAWITEYQQQSAEGELQDSQLESVAGGAGGIYSIEQDNKLAKTANANAANDAMNAISNTSNKFNQTAQNFIRNLRG